MPRAPGHAAAAAAVAVWALVLLAAAPAAAAPVSIYVEGTLGPGWRVAWDKADRAAGFAAITGGGELLVGVMSGFVGAVAGARLRGGSASGDSWLEAAGELAFQLSLGERVRARLGADAGSALYTGAWSPFAGGFLGLSFDVLTIAGGRAGLALSVRLDIDQLLTDLIVFPTTTLSLNTGVGLRY